MNSAVVIERRLLRLVSVLLLLMALLGSSTSAGIAATMIGQGGHHGKYHVTDTTNKPGARCRYEGAAGSWYLQRIHVRAPRIYGTSTHLRSVGYRLLLQRHTSNGWKTVQRGHLVSGVASRTMAATLSGSSVRRNVAVAPNWSRYRAALKLIWWDAHAHVMGHVIVRIDHHRRTSDGSVRHVCRGRLLIG